MVDKETRYEIIRLHALGMSVIVDRFNGSEIIIEYGDKYYSMLDDICFDENYGIHEVKPITETITRWSFI